MILMEQASGAQGGRLFPVYTHHLDELMTLRDRTERILNRYPVNTQDERIPKIRRLHDRLERVAQILLDTFGDVAYLNGQDLKLVQKTADYLKTHPEE